jgi:hypothetical protein
LLGKHVKGFSGDGKTIQFTVSHGTDGRHRLQQIVTRQGIKSALGNRAKPVT